MVSDGLQLLGGRVPGARHDLHDGQGDARSERVGREAQRIELVHGLGQVTTRLRHLPEEDERVAQREGRHGRIVHQIQITQAAPRRREPLGRCRVLTGQGQHVPVIHVEAGPEDSLPGTQEPTAATGQGRGLVEADHRRLSIGLFGELGQLDPRQLDPRDPGRAQLSDLELEPARATPIVGATYNVNYGFYLPEYGATNSERLPGTFQLDLRIDKKFVFRKWVLSAYVDLFNIGYFVYKSPQMYILNFGYPYNPETGEVYKTAAYQYSIPSIGLRAEF